MDNTLSAFDELDIQESGWDDEVRIICKNWQKL